MPSFDTIDFLESYDIDYADHGPNCAKGHVVINCMFCGDDPSRHLGINMETGAWSCWRDHSHRGNTPAPLIKELVGCSWAEAKRIMGIYSTYQAPTLEAKKTVSAEPTKETLELPPEFKEIGSFSWGNQFVDYLHSRHIHFSEAADFDLHQALTGRWAYRIIFPFYENDNLVTWTGRIITPSSDAPRYLSYTPDGGALLRTSDTFWPYDYVFSNGPLESVILVEGPFDALKLNILLSQLGEFEIRAMCLSTASISSRQIALLTKEAPVFKNIFVLLDKGFESQAIKIASNLSMLGNCYTLSGVSEADDPGDMTLTDAIHVVEAIRTLS